MRGSERVRVENTERGSLRNQIKDPRVWNREEYRRLENESFSVFLNNLSEDVSKRELFQLFKWTGRINDIYLSRKQKSGSIYIFAFIRYTTKGGALKAISEMNRMKLRGRVVLVGEAKFRRVSDSTETRKVQGNGWTKKLEVVVAKENLDWLQKSLIGRTMTAIDFESLKDTVEKNFPQVVQVRKMGAYQAILTFDSFLNAEETYTFKMNSLLRIFHSVRRWDESEKSESRRVWLECFGVPLHVWSVDTFKMLGDMINEWVHITVGTSGFDVLVKEVGQEVYSLQCNSKNKSCEDDCRGHQNNNITKASDGVVVKRSRLTELLDSDDPAAVVLTETRRMGVENEDRLVNSETILNEWSYDNLKPNRTKLVTHRPFNDEVD
ncbi:hypothetical protein AHAS_Ahas19G0139700 [Arachis hypogaea]